MPYKRLLGHVFGVVLLTSCMSACAGGAGPQAVRTEARGVGSSPVGVVGEASREIASLLDRQAAAWNAGDIESFMRPYWQSPELTFSSGGAVTRGWGSTLANYRKRYPTREAMGTLAFSDLEFQSLGGDAMLVLGRWRLMRDDPIGGAFSLVWRRIDGSWVIVHDHTSRDP